MVHPYNGKRKGISLVEMTIAVILFGLLSAIALLYYKSLFNIDLTAKKARVAALMNQGYQLSGAYDIYVAQEGTPPTDPNLLDFNASNVLILRSLPRDISEMTSTGWELNQSILPGHAGFTFPIDLNGTNYSGVSDDDLYCAIFNHEINRSVSLAITSFNTDEGNLSTNYARYGDTFCYSEDVGGLGTIFKQWIVILK